MDTLKLGQIIEGEQHRDATHIAVAPVTVWGRAYPGEHVGVLDDGTVSSEKTPHVGIIDPFLPDKKLRGGERVWLFLYPGTIKGLRHEWTHPAFEAVNAKRPECPQSEMWLRNLADRERIDYDEMIEGAVSGNGGCFGSDDGPEEARSAEFWQHVENVTGKHFSAEHRDDTYFRCAC